MNTPRHIRQLNRELEFQRRGKRILNTYLTILISITVVFPATFLVLLNADWIDQAFDNLWVQLGFFGFILSIFIFVYLKKRFG